MYSKTGKKEKAYGHLKKVVDSHPEDYEAWIEFGQLNEHNYPEALKCTQFFFFVIELGYNRALQILENLGIPVPAELWNNIGALHHLAGDFASAEKCYQSAIHISGSAVTEYKANNITTTYNMARLLESTHKFAEASEIYKGILKEHPNYIDGYLRLGLMAKSQGQIFDASEWFKEALVINEKHIETLILLANLHLEKEEWRNAQKRFENILEKDPKDAYSLVALGNIYYSSAKAEKKEDSVKFLQHAIKFFMKVLEQDPTNIYATNGIGMILAEKSHYNEAKDFFAQVRQATSEMPDVWVNLAHIYVLQGNYVNAIKMVFYFF